MQASAATTRDIAAWIADRNRPGPSQRALDLATTSIVDTIACALAGTCERGPWLLKGTRFVDDGLPASIWGMGGKTTVRDAALLNGMLAHMLDYDDGDMISRGHPSCTIVPAIFAVAEERAMSGAALIDAYLTGYLVVQVVGRVAGKTLAARGYHVTTLTGVLGAAAGLSRLLGLSPEQSANALGIAATTASGLRANFGTDMKGYHVGRAAMAAVEAIEATLAGVTASHEILEAKDGFLGVFGTTELADGLRAEVDRLLAGSYAIETAPPVIKLYPCCHSTHACIQAALQLRPRLTGRLDMVREVIADAAHMSALYLLHSRPTTGLEAKFSMEGAVALALVDGQAGVGQFTDASVQRPEVQTMLRKVRFTTSDRMEEIHGRSLMPGSITVVTNEESFSEEVLDTRGCRTEPCTLADVRAKFRDCASGVLAASDAAEALDMLCQLSTLPDVGKVARRLRGHAVERLDAAE